jgi:hypothetical protein
MSDNSYYKICVQGDRKGNVLNGTDREFGFLHGACKDEYYKNRPRPPAPEAPEREKFKKVRFDLLLSTTDEIDGCKTVKNLGVVRGSTVRSRHVGSDFAASLKSDVTDSRWRRGFRGQRWGTTIAWLCGARE